MKLLGVQKSGHLIQNTGHVTASWPHHKKAQLLVVLFGFWSSMFHPWEYYFSPYTVIQKDSSGAQIRNGTVASQGYGIAKTQAIWPSRSYDVVGTDAMWTNTTVKMTNVSLQISKASSAHLQWTIATYWKIIHGTLLIETGRLITELQVAMDLKLPIMTCILKESLGHIEKHTSPVCDEVVWWEQA